MIDKALTGPEPSPGRDLADHPVVRVLTWTFIGGLYAAFIVVRALERQSAMRRPGLGCDSDVMFIELCVLVALFLGGFLIVEHSRRPRTWALVWWLAILGPYYFLWSYFGYLADWCWSL